MGHATSEPQELRTILAQNWLPSEKEPHILVHRSTHQQVHKHFIRILLKDFPRETALFSTRMNSHQPYICRLLFYHATHEGRTPHDTEKEFREMVIYTDRFLRLREWSREKVMFALHGLRRLISVHGPIRISEHMVCQNQYGEVKVWISENPANNHPDSKYMSEQQSMADFAAILTKRNQDLANALIGCLTLKEAAERLNRPQKQESLNPQNHSHRDQAKKKDNPDKTLMAPYKNVFGEGSEGFKSKPELSLTPKLSVKSIEGYPQSSFHPKEEEFNTQATNSITLGRYRDFAQPAKVRAQNEQLTPNKSHPKSRISNETPIDFAKGIEHNYRSCKGEAGLQFNRKNGSNVKPQEPAKPFIYQPRFQTANNLSSPMGYASMRPKPDAPWGVANDSPNLVSTVSYHQRREAKPSTNFKEGSKSGGGEAITIINHNVNNYINNVTHNHILSTDSKPPQQEQVHQFRTQSRKEQTSNISPNGSNQFFKNPYKGKEKFGMPNFLQQKKKPSSQWVEEPSSQVSKCKSNINLIKKDTITSNPQESPNQSSHVTSFHHIEDADPSKRHQKVINFNKNYDPTLSGHKSSTPTFSFNVIAPRTPPPMSPQNFSSFHKGFTNAKFQMPLRTKTTEFYHKGKDVIKKDEIQNKSFTQHELEKSIYEQKQAEEQERKIISVKQLHEEPAPILEKAAESAPPPATEPESGKLQFKKQLRNEFKFLLGGAEAKEGKEKEESTRTTLNSKADEGEVKEGNLKDKIIRKQIMFTELKKEALKVLTDL